MQSPEEPQPAPQNPNSNPTALAAEDQEFAQALAEVEHMLVELKGRHEQIIRDQHLREDLRQTEQELRTSRRSDLKAELKYLKAQMEDLELALESRLISWRSFRDIFWQVIRFGGLGVVLGWILKSCAS